MDEWVHWYSLSFAFYPGAAKNKKLIIDEEGIFLNYYSFWNGKKEYSWSSIRAVEVKKNWIVLTKDTGSTERIKLPIYTEDQMENLKSYLQHWPFPKKLFINDSWINKFGVLK